MSREDVTQIWRERLADLAMSGTTQKLWCQRNGIPTHQLAYWKRRLNDAEGSVERGGTVDWCPVQLVSEAASGSPASRRAALTIRVGNASIDVTPDFDVELLARVVRVLDLASAVKPNA